jgi:ABC-type transporter Mla subunit MlaD
MKVLLALVAGYAIGASAGNRDFDQLVQSMRAIRESEEFDDFVAALRAHAGQTLRELANLVDRVGPPAPDSDDLVARVRQIAGVE